MEAVIEQLKGVAKNVLKLDSVEHLSAETRLFEDLNLDSTSSFELLIAMEEVIPGLMIDPETLERHHFQSLGNLAQYVLQNTQAVN